jgi:hypothetical protein
MQTQRKNAASRTAVGLRPIALISKKPVLPALSEKLILPDFGI